MRDFIIKYRKKHGLSIVGMAKLIGVSQTCYYGYEVLGRKPNKNSKLLFSKFYEENNKVENPKVEVKLQRKTEKVRIESVEELISSLNDGKDVFSERGYIYKKIDGFIVKYSGNLPVFVSSALDLSDKYYIEDVIPLSLKIGYKYINEDGQTVHIFSEDENGFLGVIEGCSSILHYTSAGKSDLSSDLIEEA
ncbi:MAG: hypothetical protein NC124_02010 [Clostridium sp.]|nr:hypothetical protein [Clostridium sp.]